MSTPVPLINFPAAIMVDGILSYLHWIFGNEELTPSEYRWDVDDKKSKIRIAAPFVIDNAKPMSAPFIVVERGGLQFDNRIIDNLKTADTNTFANPNFVAIADGSVNIICGSKEGAEASSIANYVSIMLQADRHGIISNLSFLRNLYHVDIGPEVPVVKDTEIRRWEVTIRLFVSLQMGWIKVLRTPTVWNSMTVYEVDKPVTAPPLSTKGVIIEGSDILCDETQRFGIYNENSPQLLPKELSKGWYSIRFCNNVYSQLYTIVEIVDEHHLRLQTHDTQNTPVAWRSPESKSDVSYNLIWNDIHLKMEIPTRPPA